jgi:hypothetical protein
MFLLDNILLSPLHGVLWVARELDKVAQEELANESGTIRADLSGLYLLLEKGQITEEEFDAREKVLLDRLDAISERLVADEGEEEEEGEAQGEGDREGYKKVESEKALEGVGG